jgi:rhamnosyltransferase
MLWIMAYRVAAYITAYQDSYALDRCITALENQSYPIQEIFVVDNSPVQLFPSNNYKNVVIDFHPENLGVAGGIKLGISWAIEKGYDFLWLFDQDSVITSDLLEKLLVKFQDLEENGNRVGIISVLPIDANTNQEIHGWTFSDYRLVPAPGHFESLDFYPCDVVITSGTLVNLKAAKNVEPPMSELFLDAADWAYCMNFRNKGYEVIVLKTAKMIHRIGNYSKVKVRGINGAKEINIYLCSPFRYYYSCRNHTFFETRASIKKFLLKSVIHRLFYLIRMLGRILLYEPDSLLIKMWACILGTFDGFRGRLGKTW